MLACIPIFNTQTALKQINFQKPIKKHPTFIYLQDMKPIEFQRTFSVLGPKPPILAGKNRRPISRSTVAQ